MTNSAGIRQLSRRDNSARQATLTICPREGVERSARKRTDTKPTDGGRRQAHQRSGVARGGIEFRESLFGRVEYVREIAAQELELGWSVLTPRSFLRPGGVAVLFHPNPSPRHRAVDSAPQSKLCEESWFAIEDGRLW